MDEVFPTTPLPELVLYTQQTRRGEGNVLADLTCSQELPLIAASSKLITGQTPTPWRPKIVSIFTKAESANRSQTSEPLGRDFSEERIWS